SREVGSTPQGVFSAVLGRFPQSLGGQKIGDHNISWPTVAMGVGFVSDFPRAKLRLPWNRTSLG
ncbi:MAG: hypothetical protein WCF18_13675, partial [Chthoniobacteraceae bacterium]